MNTAILKHKCLATGIHLSLSLAVFAVALYLILAVWYPGLLFHIDGGWQGVRIMIAVDLVLGPLLTFIVFNPSKPKREIKLDLSLIALVQIAALCWGFWAVNHVKPLALAYGNGAFQSVVAEELEIQEQSPADIENFGPSPVLIFGREPANGEESAGVAAYEMLEGIPPSKLVFLWEPLTDNMDAVEALSADALKQEFPDKADAIEQLPGKLVRFQGRYGYGVMALSESGEWLDSLVLTTY
ncbi:hypothetical protein FHR99_002726 [Litorivivens lipolytica]|uniref:Pilus assembly protein n=1 Tax=Litorivivens lipolytica TaxID=1524264 RepID=A0A7W4Z6Q1_9GAMM|nr:hypothetical protein [Litorivivens lipolytica]MBB3048452.1 hypothetical protein [Litorivivens lipolytica]